MNVLLINYGTSNINSIYNSLKKIKKIKIFINNFKNKKYDKIIFPGQGHIKNSSDFIFKNNINKYLNNTHILGICIGYHIFFNKSEENYSSKCLNIFNENINLLSNNCCTNNFIPNIGWKIVEIIKYHKIFKNIPKMFTQYFMHSYSSIFKNNTYSYAISKFNNKIFNSIVIKNNYFLFQFHPEKSGNIGYNIIKNFLQL
ncbi:imidazole glycerol phosphate synthase subunit HisH [Candidatus Carsonella ruddii]|uniref:Imidazole glycerol phosphate synthase, glutamine amidotransferase subunit n=1 Tax=Candidatus Carsonella ruddii HC isolate Thao2000 TaxID=1202538 RepID=J3TW38_CARRU|nr:imidazole glycerol phosphate synthase subunit HisH [Candidatus Carsonella ruddii]AFP83925.1 imidazole glycerol phosphate synthase, glutamine amidotransferase subunit [Candidatus Carsonella ruddii HC isolate Thao2000]